MLVDEQQFKEFGVNFVNATVTNVALPDDLSQCLEEASKIESQIQEEIRSQEYDLKQYNDEQDLKMKQLELESQRDEARLMAKKELLQIEMATKLEEARRVGEDKLMAEVQKTETEKVKAEAALRDDQTKAKLQADEAVQKAQLEAAKRKREIDMWAQKQVMEAEAELQRVVNEAKVMKIEADAEAAAANEMRSLRDHELAMSSIDALKAIASKNTIVINGAAGERLVHSAVQGTSPL